MTEFRLTSSRRIVRVVLIHGLVIALFSVLAAYRMSATFQPDHTAAGPGDGWGTVGNIFDIHQNLKLQGPSFLIGDIYYSETVGGGLNSGHPANFFWKTVYGVSGFLLSAQDSYDATGFAAYVLIGWAGFLMGGALGAPLLLKIVLGLLLVSLEHFQFRLCCHLQFTPYFVAVLLLLSAYRAGRRPDLPRVVTMAVAAWFTFLINEYYGYHGLFPAGALFLITMVMNRSYIKIQRAELWKALLFGALLFVVLMALTYPTMVGSRILSLLGLGASGSGRFAYSSGEFYHYAIRWPFPLFAPSLDWLRPLTPDFILKSPAPPEFTFRVGYSILLVIGPVCLYLLARRWKFRNRGDKADLMLIGAFVAVVIVAYCLAIPPNRIFALSGIAETYAPMFRVSVRALIYAQIAVLCIYLISLRVIWSHRPRASVIVCLRNGDFSRLGGHILIWGFIGVSSFIAVWDTSIGSGPPFSKIPTENLPTDPVYEVLKRQPDGMVLNLPFHYWPANRPEADYNYVLARRLHGKPILNGISFRSNSVMVDLIGRGLRINQTVADRVGLLRDVGVHYLLLNSTGNDQFDRLQRSPLLTMLHNSPSAALFRVEGARQFDRELFKQKIYALFPDLKFSAAGKPPGNTGAASGAVVAHPFREGGKVRLLRVEGDVPRQLSFGLSKPIPPGRYRAEFYMGAKNLPDSGAATATIEVFRNGAGVSAEKEVRVSALNGGRFGKYAVEFACQADCTVEPRVRFMAPGEYFNDMVIVKRLAE